MLNTSIKIGDTNVTFNAPCTGMIQKSHPKSNFIRFQNTSNLSRWVFSFYPRLTEEEKDKIVVLQVMCYGNEWILIEYVYEKDI